MSSVKVSLYVFLDDKTDKKIDKKINKLLDRLGAVDTTDLKLSWDDCEWETLEKGEE